MIEYKDVIGKLKEKGFSTYKLAKENIINARTVQRIREGKPITTETLDIICNILECQPNDVLLHKCPWEEDE